MNEINLSPWIDIRDRKPDRDVLCWVCNSNYGGCFTALYYTGWNVFVLYNPEVREHPTIDVTHWIELPSLPRQD